MAKRTQGRRTRPRKRRKFAPSSGRPEAGPTLVTPEGDLVTFVRARYTLPPGIENRQAAMAEIAELLAQAEDFGEGDEVDIAPDAMLQFPWYETDPGAKPTQDPMQRRVLAVVTLKAEELEVETMSQPRMARCRRRLEDLLETRVHLAETTTRSAAEVLAGPPPADAPEPVALPPEVVAEMEDRMLRQWLDESIPALDGMTPREAARTPEGRQMLEDLFAYIERRYPRERRAPGMMSPDYRKAKQMLGLE